jgi:hypothetical protein
VSIIHLAKALIENCFHLHAEDFFLSHGLSYWKQSLLNNKQNAKWRSHGSVFGYGIGHHASGYMCFKRTLVYHRGNHKTNRIMVVYSLINEDGVREVGRHSG